MEIWQLEDAKRKHSCVHVLMVCPALEPCALQLGGDCEGSMTTIELIEAAFSGKQDVSYRMK